MKIAIPTDDGLTLAEKVRPAKGFLVVTVQLGEIVNQQLRWNLKNGVMTQEESLYGNLMDCDSIIVREIEEGQKDYLKSESKEVIPTREKIITCALMNYLNSSLRKESNTCCCP
jgi:predicted Fe-Mo cluster-binding NifX family protein